MLFINSMRCKRFGLFIVASLCSWIVISYLLFVHCPNCPNDERLKQNTDDSFNDLEIEKLENQIQSLTREYNNLIEEFRKLIKKKKKSLLLSKLRNSERHLHQNQMKNVEGVLSSQNPKMMPEKENTKNFIENRNHIEIMNVSINSSVMESNLNSVPASKLENGEPVIAVLVLSCNRVTVAKCLNELLKWRPSKEQFPIIVSQDCSHQPTTDVLLSYGDQITLIRQPDQSEIPIPIKEKKFLGYFKIARHYGWALNQTFFHFKFDTAIIVEDDLTIAPDFFEYFLGTYWLLKKDPTLWCVSAWNDNGKSGLINENQPELLYRTDFFPGLGWMLTSSLWAELSGKWPKSYWDDWIRKPEQRKNRACIRPELPRTKTFGKVGVSNGLFYEKHLKYIKLNNQFVKFTRLNLSYLLKDNYDVEFVKNVYSSPELTYEELKNNPNLPKGSLRLPYYTKDQYKKTAKFIGLMEDFRSGVPRTAYRGVVTFSYKGRKVYLAPRVNWKGYDVTWS